jgi:ABC-2 type transport system permease protein
LTRLVLTQVRRGALVVIVVAGGMSALVAAQYQSTFADALDSESLRALATNGAIRTLFGPPLALDDPGGFTVWRTATPLAVIVGAWALLAATRLTRGEEEAGRWYLLLAGRPHTSDLVVCSLAVLTCVVMLIGVAVAAALLVTGTAVTGSLLHAAGIASVGLGFAALGTCAAQILPTRATATGFSAAVLGATLLARMVADGADTLSWLRWCTPFGLIAETRPYADDRPGPLVVLLAVPLALAAIAVVATRRRDVGAGLLTVRTRRRPRTILLRSVAGFTARRALRPITGWGLGVAAYFLLIGLLSGSVTAFLTDNPRFAELAATAGFSGLGSVPGYAAAMFSLLAIPAGLYATSRISAVATDETSRRLVLLVAQPISRLHLACTELAVAAGGVVTLLTTAALAFWAGTAAAGIPLPASAALAGALNVTPIALLCLGAAMLAWGARPVAVAVVGPLPVIGGFLLHVLAPGIGTPAWVAQLSPFTHLAAVPATAPDWPATGAMTGAALLLASVGLFAYAGRDLAL